MKFIVRRAGLYKTVVLQHESLQLDLGILDQAEVNALAVMLISTVRELGTNRSDSCRQWLVEMFAEAGVELPVKEEKPDANTSLIAAAPDLLGALKAAIEASGCDGDLCAHQWHEDARAAIARAEWRGE